MVLIVADFWKRECMENYACHAIMVQLRSRVALLNSNDSADSFNLLH